MDIQTKDGILLRNIPDGTPDDVIKERLAQIRAGGSSQDSTPPPVSARQAEDASMSAYTTSPPDTTRTPQTLQEYAKDVYGFKDYAHRGNILPFGKTSMEARNLPPRRY